MSMFNTYRPTVFDSMNGNKATIAALTKLASDPKRPHTYLFSGLPGTGKTTSARIFAKMIGASDVSIREMNMADTRGIDDIREIIEETSFSSLLVEPTVWIIDEVHQVTDAAANAMLKSLEEPPEWVYFILCTTDPQRLNKAILSRCSSFQFSPLTKKETVSLLKHVTKDAGILDGDDSVTMDMMRAIHDVSDGLPRKSLTLFEAVLAINDEEDRWRYIEDASSVDETQEVIDVLRAIAKGEKWSVLRDRLHVLQAQKTDPERIRRSALSYLSKMLLSNGDNTISRMIDYLSEPTYNTGFPGLVNAIYKCSTFKLREKELLNGI